MHISKSVNQYQSRTQQKRALAEPAWVRNLLILITLAFLTLFLFLPLAAVFSEALGKGWQVY
ncbi:MAG: sulfate/thiosulfate ABC transporter permease CysW, partial [Methylophilaceae bacterium]